MLDLNLFIKMYSLFYNLKFESVLAKDVIILFKWITRYKMEQLNVAQNFYM